jgi:hypothetical protein
LPGVETVSSGRLPRVGEASGDGGIGGGGDGGDDGGGSRTGPASRHQFACILDLIYINILGTDWMPIRAR